MAAVPVRDDGLTAPLALRTRLWVRIRPVFAMPGSLVSVLVVRVPSTSCQAACSSERSVAGGGVREREAISARREGVMSISTESREARS